MAVQDHILGVPVENWTPRQRPFQAIHKQYAEAMQTDGPWPRLSGWADVLLRGKSSMLAPLHPGYAEELFEAYTQSVEGSTTSTADVWRFLPVGPFENVNDFRTFLTSLLRSATTEDWSRFFMVVLAGNDPATAKPVGFISYLRIFPNEGSIETGFVTLSPSLQRTTTATEVHYLMMKHVFELGYRRYEWKCHAGNLHSRRAAQRLGFSFEGIHRNALIQKGRNRDTAWFSVIDSEWPALQAAYRAFLDEANFDETGRQKASLSSLTKPLLSALDPGLSEDETQKQ